MSGTDTVDRKLEESGGFGRYQWLHTVLLGLISRFVLIWQTTAITFTGDLLIKNF